MRLDQCDLDGIDAVSGAPFERNAPEDEWLDAAGTGAIPTELFNLYQRASFLSFGTAPRFLSDTENLLFSYFGLVVRSIQESLVDAREQAGLFAGEQELVYDPMKKLRGEHWEKDADKRARRHFRDLVIALQTSLDALADVIAIFFPECIKGLEVGRAQFSKIELWLSSPFVASRLVVTPSEFYVKKLYDALEPLIRARLPETDWLPMMRLLRNKAAHLGQPLFRQWGLPRLGDGKMFAFIPRQWPYLWESLIKPASQKPATPLPELLRASLIHQDIVTYSRGLLTKVQTVIATTASVLNEAYEQFKNLPENQSALMQLKDNFKKYDFESFIDA
jgi:hypothetical protein